MSFIHFLMESPVVAFMLLLVLLVTVVPILAPIAAAVLFRKNKAAVDDASEPVKAPSNTRFLGTQMDIAILIFVLFLLLGLVSWVYKTFFH